jgi:4-hydroxy-2-oxoglutarate aldolase
MDVKLEGILPALTTPFAGDDVSPADLRRNIGRYERLNLAGYLVLGSTGEAVLLDGDERRRLLDAARASIPADKPMVVGVPAESTRDALHQARVAAECGANVVLTSTPHYFRSQMTAAALIDHFTAVAESSPAPLLLYNVPKFTGLALPVDVVARMSEHENVVGLKESSGDLDYLRRVLAGVEPGFRVLGGDSSVLRAALDAGAVGAILAAATFLPEPLVRISKRTETPGDVSTEVARATAFVAGRHGVGGIKVAMDVRGLYGGPVRGPLPAVSEEARCEIEREIARLAERQVIPRRGL